MTLHSQARVRLQHGDRKRLLPTELKRVLHEVAKGIDQRKLRKLADRFGVSLTTIYVDLARCGVHLGHIVAPEPEAPHTSPSPREPTRPTLRISAGEKPKIDLTERRKHLDIEKSRLDSEWTKLDRERRELEAERRSFEQEKLDVDLMRCQLVAEREAVAELRRQLLNGSSALDVL